MVLNYSSPSFERPPLNLSKIGLPKEVVFPWRVSQKRDYCTRKYIQSMAWCLIITVALINYSLSAHLHYPPRNKHNSVVI